MATGVRIPPCAQFATLAQRQSNCFVNSRSRVQISEVAQEPIYFDSGNSNVAYCNWLGNFV